MPSVEHHVTVAERPGSLLCGNCNRLLTTALNYRADGHDLQWFALQHADISPEPGYLDKLVAEAEAVGADLLSVAVPIKDQRGVTSTALGAGKIFGQLGRLSFAQLRHPDFPETFDARMATEALRCLPTPLGYYHPDARLLLCNTGLMIVRLDRPWSRRLVFRTLDRIVELPDGRLQPQDLSEDWYFSWRVARLGGRVFCTTKVHCKHRGEVEFPNDCDYPAGLGQNDFLQREYSTELDILQRRSA